MTVRSFVYGVVGFVGGALLMVLGGAGVGYSNLPNAYAGGPWSDSLVTTGCLLGMLLFAGGALLCISSPIFAAINPESI